MADKKKADKARSTSVKRGKTATSAKAPKSGKRASAASGKTTPSEKDQWRELVDTSAAWIWKTDADIKHTYTNTFVTKCLGYPPDEFLRLRTLDLIHPDDRDQVRNLLKHAMARGKGWSEEVLRWRHKDGSWRYIESSGSGLFDKKGNFLGLCGVDRDITDQLNSARDMKEREARLRNAQQLSHIGDWMYTIQSDTLRWSDELYRIFEIDPAKTGLSLDHLLNRIHPEDRATFKAELSDNLPFRSDYRILLPDGRVKYIQEKIVVHRDQQGLVTSYSGTAQDITERKLTESKLKEDAELFQSLTEQSITGVTLIQDNVFVYVNPHLAKILGYQVVEMIGLSPHDLADEDDRQMVQEQFRKRLSGEVSSVRYSFKTHTKTGEPKNLEIHGAAITFRGRPAIMATVLDITERKQAEETLRRSEARYRTLYEGTPVMMHSINAQGLLVSVSDQWLKTLGYAREEVLGRRSTEFLDEPSGMYARTVVIPEFMRTGTCTNIPYTFVKKNGERVDTLLSAIAERDESGNVMRSLAVIVDMTEKKRTEDALRNSEKMLQTIIDAEPECVKLLDVNANLIMMNRAGLEMLQVETLEQVKGQCVCPLITSEYKDPFLDLTKRVFQGESGTLLFEIVGVKGRHLWLETHAVPLRNEKEEIIALLGLTRNVTERIQKDEALRQSEERFRAITMTATDAILLMDDRGRIVYWNPAAERIFDYSAEEAQGQDLHKFLAPQRMQGNYQKGFARFVVTGQGPVINKAVELVAMKKDGTEFPIEVSTSAMNISGKWHALGMVRDITERKRAEEALRENQARLDLALQSAHMGVWRWEIKENRRYFDELTCQLLGVAAETFTGTAEEFYQTVHPEDREKVNAALSRTLERDALYEPAYRVIWPDGSVRHIAARAKLVRDEKGQPTRINGILWDVTDQNLLEQELIKTQKLESIGTLAGGIAHDFNNLLQGIFGYISMAKLTYDQKEKSLAMLEQAEKALHLSVNLTSQLLTFSKGGKPVKKIFALRPVIENSVKFALSGSPVTPVVIIDDDLSSIDADEGQVGQVIQNIVLNAEQAMPLGGTIMIKAENVPASRVPSLQGEAKDHYIAISIQDQGTGIPADHVPRIFDPYFTTKEKGSGLGLATSYSIIRNHGGTITVISELGKGTVFTIYLPATDAQAVQAVVSLASTTVRKGRILVMDDEQVVREIAGELIRELGHEVDFAEHGEEALDKYQQAMANGKPFDIVILDLTIRGGMGGLKTVKKLLEMDPGVKAVVSSGYSDDADAADYHKQGFKTYLKKPYTIDSLREVLNEMLA